MVARTAYRQPLCAVRALTLVDLLLLLLRLLLRLRLDPGKASTDGSLSRHAWHVADQCTRQHHRSERLTQVLEAERESPREFQPLPFHYVEISRLLFDHARDDIPEIYMVRSLIEDIRDVRFHKVETGLETISTRTHAVKEQEVAAQNMPPTYNLPALNTSHPSPSSLNPKLVNLIFLGSEAIVAKGLLLSDDPSKVVGGMKLGDEWVEVLLRIVNFPEVVLLRPQKRVNTLQDALIHGSTIAWLKNFAQKM